MKKGILVFFSVLVILAFAGMGLAQDKPVSLKLGHAVTPVHPYHLGAVKFCRTGGPEHRE